MPSTNDAPRPRLLVGSSAASRSIVEFLKAGLRGKAEITTWCEGEWIATPSAFDLAVFVLSGPRDGGVLFRLGEFAGALGRDRVLVLPAPGATELPADLQGLTVAAEPATIERHLVRAAASRAGAAAPPAGGPVARRRRRSLGTARSSRPERELRVADISMTGALLETFGEIPPGQKLDLDIELPGGAHVRVEAAVIRVQYPQWGRVGGVGVQFTRFERGSREILEKFLEPQPAPEPAA
jgi:hypothetical protein